MVHNHECDLHVYNIITNNVRPFNTFTRIQNIIYSNDVTLHVHLFAPKLRSRVYITMLSYLVLFSWYHSEIYQTKIGYSQTLVINMIPRAIRTGCMD